MNNLVLIDSNKESVYTTSEIISVNTNKSHKDTLELIRKHVDDLQAVGRVTFETRVVKRTQGGGTPQEIAILDDYATMLLITHMRSIGVVKTFKLELVKEFKRMRSMLKSSQITMSQADREMLEISRIDTRTMKAISKTRNNAIVHENYETLVKLGILESRIEMRKTTRYRFTADGADYSNGYFHGIPRFEPELHEKIIEVISQFKKGLEFQGDLFIERD
jgi:phage regulator Rha-like protein